jgi:hypothetical protein
MDQQFAQILIAAFADPQKLWLAAGRRLFGYQAKPGREIAPLGKLSALPTAAIKAKAMVTPMPGIETNSRVFSSAFSKAANQDNVACSSLQHPCGTMIPCSIKIVRNRSVSAVRSPTSLSNCR